MIASTEIQRIAGSQGVAPMVIDYDYSLGCFLHYLALQPEVRASWLFKGGTSLQKCHFGNYRFSEDLDFTLVEALAPDGLRSIVDRAKAAMQSEIGIRTDESPTRIESIEDDYGKESLEARVYYRATWDYGGQSKSLRVQVSRGELVTFAALTKSISHGYSDADQLPATHLRTYSLEEILLEKLRAFSGQRKHAIARDIFDIYYLVAKGADVDASLSAFAGKCLAKGIDPLSLTLNTPRQREPEYRLNWEKNLEYLVPQELKIPFGTAWNTALDLLQRVLSSSVPRQNPVSDRRGNLN
jgi:predicted nucleotidyltransferase component of viral defense system